MRVFDITHIPPDELTLTEMRKQYEALDFEPDYILATTKQTHDPLGSYVLGPYRTWRGIPIVTMNKKTPRRVIGAWFVIKLWPQGRTRPYPGYRLARWLSDGGY